MKQKKREEKRVSVFSMPLCREKMKGRQEANKTGEGGAEEQGKEGS